MSEGQAQTTESNENVDSNVVNESLVETNDNENHEPQRADYVDPEKDDPEKVRERINYLYGKYKTTEAKYNQDSKQWRDLAADQARVIEELRTGQGAIINHLQGQTFADAESQIENEMQAAFDAGDSKGYIAAQNKLIDLKADKKIAERSKPAPQAQVQQHQTNNQLDSGDYEIVRAWQNERDEHGNVLRSWSNARSPQYQEALVETNAVFTRYPDYTMEQKLAEVDRRMGIKKPEARQSVLSGGLTNKPKNNKISLSPKQQEIAIRTKFGSSKGAKTDAEYIEHYRKQIANIKPKGAK